MAFTPKTAPFSGKINAVTLGTGDKAIVIGGQNVMPFYTFDAAIEHAPKIGIEISDLATQWDAPALKEFYAGCTTMVDFAKKAETMPGADFLCLHFESADPNGANRSVADCVADAKAVAEATTMPIVVMGCKNIEKDGELFSKIAEALQGKNILVLSARNEDYKTVGASVALAYGQKVGAETADDINLAKQLNIMLKGLSINPENIVMNIGTAAVGYGFEYVASTLDRVRLAALAQSDADLQMPIMSPVSPDAGSRISNIDLAAANDAICIALCSADGIAKDNEERMKHCHNLLERGMSLGMDATDLWFDPLFLVVKGMQDKQMEVLEAIKMFASEGLKSTGGLSNNSNGAPKTLRPIMDSALVAMAMMQGLTSAIVNPCDLRLMETIKSCDIFKNHVLYSDSYLDL